MNFETEILIISFVIAIILGLIIIPILKKLKVGQIERDDGPKSHLKKQGTPTMGGIIMMITMILSVTGTYVFFSVTGRIDIANKILPMLILTLGFGVIAFVVASITIIANGIYKISGISIYVFTKGI